MRLSANQQAKLNKELNEYKNQINVNILELPNYSLFVEEMINVVENTNRHKQYELLKHTFQLTVPISNLLRRRDFNEEYLSELYTSLGVIRFISDEYYMKFNRKAFYSLQSKKLKLLFNKNFGIIDLKEQVLISIKLFYICGSRSLDNICKFASFFPKQDHFNAISANLIILESLTSGFVGQILKYFSNQMSEIVKKIY